VDVQSNLNKTRNGKIDRQALLNLARADAEPNE
jgi:hypothetical protein